MAIKMVKKTKTVKPQPTEEVVLEDAVSTNVAPAVEETKEQAPAPKQKTRNPKDWVEVNMFEEIDPAPVIGDFSFANQLRLTKLEEKKTYRMPLYVAEVIVDRKKGIILPG